MGRPRKSKFHKEAFHTYPDKSQFPGESTLAAYEGSLSDEPRASAVPITAGTQMLESAFAGINFSLELLVFLALTSASNHHYPRLFADFYYNFKDSKTYSDFAFFFAMIGIVLMVRMMHYIIC